VTNDSATVVVDVDVDVDVEVDVDVDDEVEVDDELEVDVLGGRASVDVVTIDVA
jgi:hypothetical protein